MMLPDEHLEEMTAAVDERTRFLVDAYERGHRSAIQDDAIKALHAATHCALGWNSRLATAGQAFAKAPDFDSRSAFGRAAMNMKSPLVDLVTCAQLVLLIAGQPGLQELPEPDAALALAKAELQTKSQTLLLADHIGDVVDNGKSLMDLLFPVARGLSYVIHEPSRENFHSLCPLLESLVRGAAPMITGFELSGIVLVALSS
jgi:hypothetical protein